MDLYTICLIVFFISFGVSMFIPERVIGVIAGVSAIIAGILLLVGRG